MTFFFYSHTPSTCRTAQLPTPPLHPSKTLETWIPQSYRWSVANTMLLTHWGGCCCWDCWGCACAGCFWPCLPSPGACGGGKVPLPAADQHLAPAMLPAPHTSLVSSCSLSSRRSRRQTSTCKARAAAHRCDGAACHSICRMPDSSQPAGRHKSVAARPSPDSMRCRRRAACRMGSTCVHAAGGGRVALSLRLQPAQELPDVLCT